jgi:hypothetical protein
MTSIDSLWTELGVSHEIGVVRRVDETHPSDIYAALDATGRPGLVLVTTAVPSLPPPFEAVEVTISHRSDKRLILGIWLRTEALSSLFGRLCQDLVEASRHISPSESAGYMLTRLMRWRRLLEAGDSAALSPAQLRGVMGELIVLQRCYDLWPPAEVVHSWVGPLDAPQDFTLPSLRIEAKAIRPGAAIVRISSVDQLDVTDATLILSVVTLASIGPEVEGISPAGLVTGIRQRLVQDGAQAAGLEFESRLAASGYTDLPQYEQSMFRLEEIRFFEVHGTFPRLRRADLPPGVADASYQIELGVCAPFAVTLQR